jgi:hypothetical protein
MRLILHIALGVSLIFLTACEFGGSSCRTVYKRFQLGDEQKRKFSYGERDITLTYTDSAGTHSVNLAAFPKENFMYSNEYDPGPMRCSTVHDAEIIRKKYQSTDLRHMLQVSLFSEEYVGYSATGTQYAKSAAVNSFMFQVDTLKIYVPEGALGFSSSPVLRDYEVKVGKDTVLASFAGTLLQSVYYKKKGLKWEFK